MLDRSARARLVVALLIAVGLAVGPRAALCIGDAGHVAIEAVDADCCDGPHPADQAGRCAPHEGESGDCTDRPLTLLAVAPAATQECDADSGHRPSSADALATWPGVHLDWRASILAPASVVVRLPGTPRQQRTTIQRC